EPGDLVGERGEHDRGAHAGEAVVAARGLVDGQVGRLDGLAQRLGDVGGVGLAQRVVDGADGERSGLGATYVAPHAVTDDGQGEVGKLENTVAVLVFVSQPLFAAIAPGVVQARLRMRNLAPRQAWAHLV